MLGALMGRLFQGIRMAGILRQSPMWIKAAAGPWHLKMPQKMIGHQPCPRDLVTDLWF